MRDSRGADSHDLYRDAAASLALLGLATGDAYASPNRDKVSEITQLTLATAEGLIRGTIRFRNGKQPVPKDQVASAYLRWAAGRGFNLHSESRSTAAATGWLSRQPVYLADRPGGETTVAALGEFPYVNNNSKGSACVPRAAPCGFFHPGPEGETDLGDTYWLGAQTASITHGHNLARASAGLLAALLRCLSEGQALDPAVESALSAMHERDDIADEAARKNLDAYLMAASDRDESESSDTGSIADLHGWSGHVAEQALAIGVWAARSGDLSEALQLATSHAGEKRATAAIAGALWGASAGRDFVDNLPDYAPLESPYPQVADELPAGLAGHLEGFAVVERVASDLVRITRHGSDLRPADQVRYPGV